jgi:hypothetical protein
MSYSVFVGPIPDHLHVCHRCDVRNCVNPDHLFLGTHTENMRDMTKKGRLVLPYQDGEANPSALTNEADVRKIRELYATGEYSQLDLGKLFKLNRATIGCIVRRERWKHIT